MSNELTSDSHAFAPDLQVSFEQLSDHAYAYTVHGNPNAGVIIGDSSVVVVDTQPTPLMAGDLIARIRAITDNPITHVVLSHYHAARVLGASALQPEHVVASRETYALIEERGVEDMQSEIERFPKLFCGADSIKGLTWPDMVFKSELTIWDGELEIQMLQLGRGHTKGDIVVWLPNEKVLFAGDLVESGATPYAGDAYFENWPATLNALERLQPEKIVPGRGPALNTREASTAAISSTREFVGDLYALVKAGVAREESPEMIYQETLSVMKGKFGHWTIFEHCMPFNVSRALDEATSHVDPRIWTARRDKEMRRSLAGV